LRCQPSDRTKLEEENPTSSIDGPLDVNGPPKAILGSKRQTTERTYFIIREDRQPLLSLWNRLEGQLAGPYWERPQRSLLSSDSSLDDHWANATFNRSTNNVKVRVQSPLSQSLAQTRPRLQSELIPVASDRMSRKQHARAASYDQALDEH
jgi:hypothetical protein